MGAMPKKKQPLDQGQIALFQAQETPNAFRKPVQVIHSKPKTALSLLHRKLANAWLKNASETEPDADGWWTIHIATMVREIDFNSNNRNYLIESSRALMGIIFEWDVIAPEGKRKFWKASVLFNEVEILTETIRYQISRQLRDQVLTPEMYALIDFNVQNRFRRATSLALYEHCFRFEKIHRTAEVEWQLFRDILMGESSDAKSYQEYKVFKDKVLKVAIAEVNSVSDITIEMNEKRLGRRVQAISFTVSRNETHATENFDNEQAMLDIGEMVKLGLLQSEARALSKKYSHQQIAAALAYTRKRAADKKASKIDNTPAYFRKALGGGWGVVEAADGAAKKGSKSSNTGPDLAELYQLEVIKEAEEYFGELNAQDQKMLIDEYNDTDVAPSLKIKRSSPGKAVRTEFFKWLALKTWGHPKPEELLMFAQKLMREKGLIQGA